MSVLGKNWLIKNHSQKKTIFERLLENRGFKSLNEVDDFHDPFLFKEMEKVLSRIDQAISGRERIIVFGDYDVDGISGTAILVHTLKKINANVSYRLPNRLTDGYGLSEKFIPEFAEKNVNLVITVDCGISCASAISLAKQKGIDVIITDHHTVPENFPSDAHSILHPKIKDSGYPFKELTGAGVALKLAHALILRYLPVSEQAAYLDSLLDFAAMGTIADLGSLRNENRLIVSKGLKALANTKWLGLKRLKELANLKEGDTIDTVKVGYQIAPRINAAGRIGDPYTALFLLLQENHSEKINILSDQLEQLNKERQVMTEQAMNEAEQFLLEAEKMPFILIAHSPDWHVGILGLIAGKMVEKYSRPAIIMQDFGDTLGASARSPEYFNIVEALTHCGELLLNFGGHAQAAGFNIRKENLQKFIEKISQYAQEKLENFEFKSTLEIDCELNQSEVDFSLLEEVENLEPFGVDNRRPTFMVKNIEPFFVDKVGQNGKHLKFTAKLNQKDFQVIAFRMGEFAEDVRMHKKIDLVFQLDRNRWNDREYLQLQALDFKLIKG